MEHIDHDHLSTQVIQMDQVSFKAHFWNDTRIVQFWYTRTAHFLVTSSRTYQNCTILEYENWWITPHFAELSSRIPELYNSGIFQHNNLCTKKMDIYISININDISI